MCVCLCVCVCVCVCVCSEAGVEQRKKPRRQTLASFSTQALKLATRGQVLRVTGTPEA